MQHLLGLAKLSLSNCWLLVLQELPVEQQHPTSAAFLRHPPPFANSRCRIALETEGRFSTVVCWLQGLKSLLTFTKCARDRLSLGSLAAPRSRGVQPRAEPVPYSPVKTPLWVDLLRALCLKTFKLEHLPWSCINGVPKVSGNISDQAGLMITYFFTEASDNLSLKLQVPASYCRLSR